MPEYILRAIIGIILISVNASVMGSFVVFRGTAFMVAGASHAALAGAAFAVLLSVNYGINFDPMLGALLSALALALLSAHSTGPFSREKMNINIGVGFALSMSLALLIITMIREASSRVWSLLVGDILLLTSKDLVQILLMTIVSLVIVAVLYNDLIFLSFDPESALAYGIRAGALNYLLLALISVAVVIVMRGVGAILVYAMLVAPAATANEIAKNVHGVFLIAFLASAVAGLSAIALSYIFPASPGALSALLVSVMYVIVLMARGVGRVGA